MKNILLVFGLCLIMSGCGEDAPPTKSNSYTPPTYKKNDAAVVAPAQPATTQTNTAQSTAAAAPATKNTLQRPGTQIINDAAAVIDYGTGATPLSIKKKQTDKIQSIQNQYNQRTNKALNEK
jgi:uncharacterized protein YceK